jgi:hypothetical protein
MVADLQQPGILDPDALLDHNTFPNFGTKHPQQRNFYAAEKGKVIQEECPRKNMPQQQLK